MNKKTLDHLNTLRTLSDPIILNETTFRITGPMLSSDWKAIRDIEDGIDEQYIRQEIILAARENRVAEAVRSSWSYYMNNYNANISQAQLRHFLLALPAIKAYIESTNSK